MIVTLREPTVQLSSHLVHDLRTPINAILGYAGLLIEDAPDDAELHRRVLPVRQCGEKLDVLIGSLPRSGAFPLGWLASVQGPLAALALSLTDLKAWPGAPADDVARIETACERLLALLAQLNAAEPQPAADAENHPPQSQDGFTWAPATDAAGIILVVDDNDLNRDLLGRRLLQLGHQVDQAGDGDTALRMMRRRPYDLLLLDIVMPGLDGYQVLERLQGDPELGTVPVLVISALTEMDSVARCIKLGAVDFLPKNVDPVVLHARVSRSIQQKRARDREIRYLKDVSALTVAAACVRDSLPVDEISIGQVAERGDDLGELARAFGRMIHEINQREATLRMQLAGIQRLEIDATSRSRAVSEITESEYFQQLRAKVKALRKR
jgi:CheY-like chemotaxis protein